MDGYEDLGLRGGLWRGQITRSTAPGRILLVHTGEVLAEAAVEPQGGGVWQVSVALPADRLTDGAATFALHEDRGAPGEALQPGSSLLATLPLIAGKALHRDLRAELTLLRAELDLLKREFRRHASEATRQHESAPPPPAQPGAAPAPQDATPVPPLDVPVETSRPEPA